MSELRNDIIECLATLGAADLKTSATALLNALGYQSGRTLDVDESPETFLAQFDRAATLNRDKAWVAEWNAIHLLFQITDDDLDDSGVLFDRDRVDTARFNSYLFFAIRLKGTAYTRGKLATITRAINRLFALPVMVLFVYGDRLSIGIINRRAHKRKQAQDVLEKVSLIRDIDYRSPHRGHVDILASFALSELASIRRIASFDDLHAAWSERLNIELLNQRFYARIQAWFFWAAKTAHFPHGGIDDEDVRNRMGLIRLLTRVIFCWFAREKRLIPSDLFSADNVAAVLKKFDPNSADSGSYYLAILQNLFFPTLAVPLDQREFRNGRRYKGRNKHYMDHRFYRHEKLFKDSEGFGALFEQIPFLNGGLFECLDYRQEVNGKNAEVRVDGFSDVPENQPFVPNVLFFGEAQQADLSDAFGNQKKDHMQVDGLFRILEGYTFTVTENTPVEEEIALDPELLGRIFENLLAEYNPETEKTARKQTGSFYTPREIVDYMVTESLKAYLAEELPRRVPDCTPDDTRAGLDLLFAYTETEHHPFNDIEKRALMDAVYELRTLDPACGSGAFPMGMLQKLVFILEKLDQDHRHWKERLLADTPPALREETRQLLERSTAEHNWKLGLIQHSIYGVDIQPIATQIAKLRCFISLLVDFEVDPKQENMGVPSLPNLDFKFVAANALIPPPGEQTPKEGELAFEDTFYADFARAAEEYFYVRDPQEKAGLRKRIEGLIDGRVTARTREIESHLGNETLRPEWTAILRKRHEAKIGRAHREIALWQSYKNIFAFRNAHVEFFDTRYFFPEVKTGFDITIGNPPYVRADEPSEWNQRQRRAILDSEAYETLWEKWDLFVPFIERSYKLLKSGGVSTMIVSDAFCHSKYAQKPQNWLLQNARILRLDFCSDIKIFDAGVHNVITFLQKAEGQQWKPLRRLHQETFGNVTLLPSDRQEALTYRAFFPEANDNACDQDGIALEAICYISVGMVAHADEKVAKGAFKLEDLVAPCKDRLHTRPFVEGKYLDRWVVRSHRWLEWGTDRSPIMLRRPTFDEMYTVPEKMISVDMSASTANLRVAYDDAQLFHNHSAWSFIPWHALSGVRNNSLKKAARYKDEKPPRPDLPRREDLEATSSRFDVKYLLGVMNSSTARDFLRANRRSNIHLYPDDWKKLPIPDVSPEDQQPVIDLVNQILAAKRANPAADIAALESEVNDRVAVLYGINSTTATAADTSSTGTGTASMITTKRDRRHDEADLKEYLRTECLPALGEQYDYFDIATIRAYLSAKRKKMGVTTLKQYLAELVAGLFVFDAGKGWYSFIREPFELNVEPLSKLLSSLEGRFPLLDFTCWSTEQIKSFTHQTLSKFVSFVYVEKHNLNDLYEALREAGYNAYLNPGADEAGKTFALRGDTIVVRRFISKQPVTGRYATIEKVLVDLCVECRKLPFMDVAEYERMATNLAGQRRIDIALLSAYAQRRNTPVTDVLGDVNIP